MDATQVQILSESADLLANSSCSRTVIVISPRKWRSVVIRLRPPPMVRLRVFRWSTSSPSPPSASHTVCPMATSSHAAWSASSGNLALNVSVDSQKYLFNGSTLRLRLGRAGPLRASGRAKTSLHRWGQKLPESLSLWPDRNVVRSKLTRSYERGAHAACGCQAARPRLEPKGVDRHSSRSSMITGRRARSTSNCSTRSASKRIVLSASR